MSSLGARLKRARERKDLTQVNASKQLGITNVQLSRYESDIHKPDPDLLAKMARLYEVTTDYLITGASHTPDESSNVAPEEAEFLKWVDDNLESSFFYDFSKSPEESKKQMMETLKFLWEQEKKRQGKPEPK